MAKKLYRSRNQKMVGGVAGGIAEYFDIDPVLVRAGFVLSVLGWGGGILLYIILWIIIPFRALEQVGVSPDGIPIGRENPFDEEISLEDTHIKDKRRNIFGALLIALGLLMLIDNILPDISIDNWWPLLLILIGGYILVNSLIFKKK